MEQINAGLSWHLAALMDLDRGDALLMPRPPLPSFLEAWGRHFGAVPQIVTQPGRSEKGFVATPWGWSNQIRTMAILHNWVTAAPAQSAVNSANSRRTSFQIEQELGITLPGASPIDSLESFRAAVTTASQLAGISAETLKWVIKAEFGMSGRERALGTGPCLPENTQRWIERRLASQSWLIFEPWLDRQAEFGVLFQIPPPEQVAPIQLTNVTELLTDLTGRYVGTILHPESATQIDLAPIRNLVQSISKTGYWGPIGVDAMRHKSPAGQICFRPAQDINARLTMGFIAHAWKQKLAPQTKNSAWLQITTEQLAQLVGQSPTTEFEADLIASGKSPFSIPLKDLPEVLAVRTSPVHLTSGPLRHVGVFLASDSDQYFHAALRTLMQPT